MKNQLFALIGLGLLLATASAYAQTGVVKANVPFNFIVNAIDLPAGEYMIQPVGSSGSAIAIQNPDNQIFKVVLPHACQSAEAQKTSKLVFHRYGSQYFLAQVWTGERPGTGTAWSDRQAEVAMDYH
jgi:hypothetical protein